jgi:hypothetical protein
MGRIVRVTPLQKRNPTYHGTACDELFKYLKHFSPRCASLQAPETELLKSISRWVPHAAVSHST